MTTQKRPKPKENQLGILEISTMEFTHFAGNSPEGLQSRREHCWDYVSVFENAPKKLLHLSPLLSGSGKGTVGA